MENLSNTDILEAIQAKGIEIMDDTRPYAEIARQYGVLPVALETESMPAGVQEPEFKV